MYGIEAIPEIINFKGGQPLQRYGKRRAPIGGGNIVHLVRSYHAGGVYGAHEVARRRLANANMNLRN